MKLFSGPTQR